MFQCYRCFVKSRIIGRQILKILKEQYLTLIRVKLWNLTIDGKVALLNQILLNIFRNYIPNKKLSVSIDSLHGWLMKERSKLTKYFYRNGQRVSDRNKVLEKSAECTREILKGTLMQIWKSPYMFVFI